MPKGLMASIAEDEAKLAAMNGEDDGADGDDTGDDADDAPAPKAKTKGNPPEDDDAGDEGDDAADPAPGKKPEAKAKAKDDDKADPAPGKKPVAKAKDGEEEDGNSLAAQLRIERKQRKEMEAKLDALLKGAPAAPTPKAAPAPVAKADGTVDDAAAAPKALTADERLDAIERERESKQLEQAAIDEFNGYEADFQKDTPDYAQASDHMIRSMGAAVRALYPNATNAQISTFIKGQVLHIAGQAAQKGLNPAETLYRLSMERYGYKKGAATPAPKPGDAKDRLEKSAAVRKRTASPLAGGGQQSNPGATIEEAAKMNLADFSRLKPGEIDQLIADSMDA